MIRCNCGRWNDPVILCRSSSVRLQLGEEVLHLRQGTENPPHGHVRPQILRQDCEWRSFRCSPVPFPSPCVLIYRVDSSHSCVITSWAGVFTWWHPWMKSCVFVLSGWKRICHTQILREENDRHPGPPVLPGDRDHRPVGQTLQAGIPTSGSVFRTERIRIWISVPSVMRFK